MPDTPQSPVPQPAKAADPSKPKYSKEQQHAAELKVVEQNAKQVEKVDKFIDEVANKLNEFLENEDQNTRTSVVERLAQRVNSIRSVAANAKKYVSRGAIQQEEKASMPRLTPIPRPGEAPIRNILAQDDQNKTAVNSGGGDK